MTISTPETQPVRIRPTSFPAISLPVVSLGNRPHAVDRVVMKVAIAMLQWTNARIAREDIARREHSSRRQLQATLLLREAHALRLTQRIGL